MMRRVVVGVVAFLLNFSKKGLDSVTKIGMVQ